MPLTAPRLDNRNFDQILRELHHRVPLYNREWTDFNESDPGETLLQLFAWLAETLLAQMNQIPERNYIKFLQLLNLELRPALPARAHLTFTVTPTPGSTAGPVLAGTKISGQPADGSDPVVFETEKGLDLIQAELGDVWVFDRGGFQSVKPANDDDNSVFRPFGYSPVPGNALYLGFVPVDGVTRVFPRQMSFRAFLPAEALAGKPVDAGLVLERLIPPVKLIWEYRPKDSTPFWQRLNVFDDETAALIREGYILVEGPRKIEPTLEAQLNAEKRFWFRVRIADGGGSYEPNRAPALEFLLPNTVEAVNLATVFEEDIGVSDGTPDQIFETARKPVFLASAEDDNPLQLQTERDDITEPWERVQDFLDAGEESAVYVLNATSGEIRFGNGIRGKIPEPGARIVAMQYRYGGGSAGNLDADLLKDPLTNLPGVQQVTNRRPATGGAKEQEIEDLKARAPRILKQRNRAVTREDFVSLAMELSQVAKAVAIERMNPEFPGAQVLGAVTVVIVPVTQEKKALPSGDLLRSVAQHLNEHRLLTTEVHVKGPEYQAIRVELQVEAKSNASFDQVAEDIIKKLDAFLSPANPDRNFGDDLIPTRLYNEVLPVEGVSGVVRMNVYVDGRLIAETDRIIVPPDGLLYPEDHIVTVVPQGDV